VNRRDHERAARLWERLAVDQVESVSPFREQIAREMREHAQRHRNAADLARRRELGRWGR
jgi:hypothetical protein